MTSIKHWEDKWTSEQTPWDKKMPVPILEHYTTEVYSKNSNIRNALVAGCGRGFDVLTLCEIPSVERVLGVDFAPTAVEAANELQQESIDSKPHAKKAVFEQNDFFKVDGKFDLAFDYTFLCALDPELRQAWADKYAELIVPGGELFTLVYPLKINTNVTVLTSGGPPFQIDYKIVSELLEPRGFENIENKENNISIDARKGNEWIARWIKK